MTNYKDIPIYEPKRTSIPSKILNDSSAWMGLELVIEDILDRFQIGRKNCIEFGVEFGYSAVAFSNFFEQVIGVDTFTGDAHTRHKGDHYEQTKASLAQYTNIELIKMDCRDWIKLDTQHYHLAHIDIIHYYQETYDCGLWAAKHSDCVLFHDTESHSEVKRAVIDIANETGFELYNFPLCYGLGILLNPHRQK